MSAGLAQAKTALAEIRAVPLAIRVPEARVLAMIEACAVQLAEVAAIEDAKEVSSVADAIVALSHKVRVATETKHAAMRLFVDAERKLGELLTQLPTRGAMPKGRALASHGISKTRANVAERLYRTSPATIDAAIGDGAKTMHGVCTKIGLLTSGYDLRMKRATAFAELAAQAVALLERSQKRGAVPSQSEVTYLTAWLAKLNVHGNAGP